MTMRAEKLVAISQFLPAFPKLFDWVLDRKDDVTVGAGELVELVRYENVRGLLLDATLKTTSDEMVIHFTIDTITTEVVPKVLWQMGLGKEESITVSVLNPTSEDIVVSWYIYFLQYTEELLAMIDEMMRENEEKEGAE